MAGGISPDPFTWDLARVVKELCTPDRTWALPSAARFPAPETLRQALFDCEVDGKSLLTYDDLLTRDSHNLLSALGIKKLPQRVAMLEAVKLLKSKSHEYRQWKLEQFKLDQSLSELPNDTPNRYDESDSGLTSRDSRPRLLVKEGESILVPKDDSTELVFTSNESSNDALHQSAEGRNGDGLVPMELEHPQAREPPQKRRRIAPVTLAASSDRVNPAFLPTEADTVMHYAPRPLNREPVDPPRPGSYLGPSKLDPKDILQAEDESSEDSEDMVNQTVAVNVPPGRRVVIHRLMKRYLRKPGSSFGAVATADTDGAGDDILPLFGDSDDEYDSDTWREMEEERAERERAAQHTERVLPREEVNDVIDHNIRQIAQDWAERKRPKLERKAYKLWIDANRRGGSRHAEIARATKTLSGLESRILAICNEIRGMQWSKRQELEQQMASVELSIMQREEQMWTIGLLSSPVQPARPTVKSGPTRVRSSIARRAAQPDEEELTSGSDDSLGDFIEHDENEQPARVSERSDGHGMKSGNDDDINGDISTDAPSVDKHDNISTPDSILGTSNSQPIPVLSSPVSKIATPQAGVRSKSPTGPGGLVLRALQAWEESLVDTVREAVQAYDANDLWAMVKKGQPAADDDHSRLGTGLLGLFRLYDVFSNRTLIRVNDLSRDTTTQRRLELGKNCFIKMCACVKELLHQQMPEQEPDHLSAPAPASPTKSSRESTTPETSDTDEETEELSSGRRRQIVRDQDAEDLREEVNREHEEQEKRKRKLRKRLAEFQDVAGEPSRLIINESKKDSEALIYVSKGHLAACIKDHQVEGVRFMWNQVVAADAKISQGCLLAHTMGLGKTMQVITLLVAIAQASQSSHESVSSQIPPHLRSGKVLVLCPAGLVDNWMDELLLWTPDGALGELIKLHAKDNRSRAVRRWAAGRGVLVVGYTIFTQMVRDDPLLAQLLHTEPDIVIADEAHKLKNPKSQVHGATAHFATKSRIALTGSPLADNVEDYYAMINWVSPNFLGPIEEFRAYYSRPIKAGLFADSKASEKRLALKKLSVLKQVAAPKMHRRTILNTKRELPKKQEFILYVPLTQVQLRAYSDYLTGLSGDGTLNQMTINGQAGVWSFTAYLASLLAHPKIFKDHLENAKAKRMQPPSDKTRQDTKASKDDEPPLSQGVISQSLAAVSGIRDILDPALSWKVILLCAILDESKRIGDKVLVFSQSLLTLDFLQQLCRQQKRRYERLDGDVAPVQRQAAVKVFNSDEGADVYLISTKAGGVGLNLQGANRVVIFDIKWSPTHEQQAIGRAYRIGQSKPVCVYWLISDGTFETTMHKKWVFKMQLAYRVVDNQKPAPWSTKMGDYFAAPAIPPQMDLSEYCGKDNVLDALLKQHGVAGGIGRIMMVDAFEQEEPDDHLLTSEDHQQVTQEVNDFIKKQPGGGVQTSGQPGGAGSSKARTSVDNEAASGQDEQASAAVAPSSVLAASQPGMPVYAALAGPIPVPVHVSDAPTKSVSWGSALGNRPRVEPAGLGGPDNCVGSRAPDLSAAENIGKAAGLAHTMPVPSDPTTYPDYGSDGVLALQQRNRVDEPRSPRQVLPAGPPATPIPGPGTQFVTGPDLATSRVQPVQTTANLVQAKGRARSGAGRYADELLHALHSTSRMARTAHATLSLCTPEHYVYALETALISQGVSEAVATDKYQAISVAAKTSAGFAIALLANQIPPKQLANLGKAEIEAMKQRLDKSEPFLPANFLAAQSSNKGSNAIKQQQEPSSSETNLTPRARGRDGAAVAAWLNRRKGRALFERHSRDARLPEFASQSIRKNWSQDQEKADGQPAQPEHQARAGDSRETPIVMD